MRRREWESEDVMEGVGERGCDGGSAELRIDLMCASFQQPLQ